MSCDAATIRKTDLSATSRRAATITLVIDGDGPAQFGSIAGIASDERSIYVADRMSNNVKVFDHAGGLQRMIGAAGRGPGEFSNLRGLAVGGDTLYVLDHTVQLFTLEGVYVRGLGPPNYNMLFADGVAFAGGRIAIMDRSASDEPSTIRTDSLVVRLYDSQGDSMTAPVASALQETFTYGARHLMGQPPLSVGELAVVSAGGRVYHARRNAIDIRVTDITTSNVDGSAGRITGCADPVRVSSSDVSDDRAFLGAMLDGRPDALAAVLKTFDDAPKPEYRPVISEMLASPEGFLLLKRMDVSTNPFRKRDPAAAALWLLLDGNGQPRGHIELPARFRAIELQRCHVLGIARDDDDVQSVVKYSFSSAGPGGQMACP